MLFADIDSKLTKKIKNEADLHNKAKILKNELLLDIESNLIEEKDRKIKEAQRKLKRDGASIQRLGTKEYKELRDAYCLR